VTTPGVDAAGSVPVEETSGPPRWLRTLTHVVALGWGTCEVAFWGARIQVLSFVLATLFGTAGVTAWAKARDLLR
jgi:hypothetical protein